MTVIYKPSEVMKKLDLKESVYKKYIKALEDQNYVFQKNQQGHRIFTDEDIRTLENFMELIKYDGMTIELVAKKIGETKGHAGITEQKKDSYDVMALVEKAVTNALEKQEQRHQAELKALSTKLESNERELSNKLESTKIELLRNSMETRKEINEVKEEILLALKEQAATKKKWWKFWE
jgi:DNA-binding transcriptional MerR regulator